MLWKAQGTPVVRACLLLAYVEKLSAILLPSALGWMNVFLEHLLSRWLSNSLLNPCGVCPMVALLVLLQNIWLRLPILFQQTLSFTEKLFLLSSSPKAWIFNAFWRHPKAFEGNLSSEKGWLDFCLKYLLALLKLNDFIDADLCHCYTRAVNFV